MESNTRKNNNSTGGNKPERTCKRRKIKEISTKGKTMQIKPDIPKQRKKIQSKTGRWHEKLPTNRYKRNRTILGKNMVTKKQQKGWMDKQYDQRIRRSRKGPESVKHIDFHKTALKNIKLENARPWCNTWFLVQEIHLYSRQISIRNKQMTTRSTCIRMDDLKKDHIDPKGSKQRYVSKKQHK